MKIHKYSLILIAAIGLISCGPLKEVHRYQFDDGEYLYQQNDNEYQAVYVENKLDQEEDTVLLYPAKVAYANVFPEIIPATDQYFLKRSFHFNILTVLFKFRPSTEGFPTQLNSNFNGALFFGYRWDKFVVDYSRTPAGLKKRLSHYGISAGIFGGVGSTAVTPWTTNYRTMDEYDGFIFTRGFAVMGSLRKLTVGLGFGLDYLADRDREIWIYQNKLWYGLTFGLNLN
ncbi:MAG TPA: hypothetical protein PKN99_13005 [Cyclobacteriaceae bacterium]|nr:hypothetical protein [Cyclobacteriaceae bacterium]